MTESRHDHFVSAPQRRVGSLGIVRNPGGAVLFVERKEPPQEHPAPFYLPGGCVEENEPVLDGLVRVARDQLGVSLEPGRLLAVHHMYEKQHATHLSREGYNFLFDCGVMDEEPEFRFSSDMAHVRWVDPGDLEDLLMTFTAARVRAALRALAGGEVEVLHDH